MREAAPGAGAAPCEGGRGAVHPFWTWGSWSGAAAVGVGQPDASPRRRTKEVCPVAPVQPWAVRGAWPGQGTWPALANAADSGDEDEEEDEEGEDGEPDEEGELDAKAEACSAAEDRQETCASPVSCVEDDETDGAEEEDDDEDDGDEPDSDEAPSDCGSPKQGTASFSLLEALGLRAGGAWSVGGAAGGARAAEVALSREGDASGGGAAEGLPAGALAAEGGPAGAAAEGLALERQPGSFSLLQALGLGALGAGGAWGGGGEEGPQGCALDDSVARVVLGRYLYRPKDLMGEGGFSTVCRGVDLLTGEPVAVKSVSEGEPGSPREQGALLAQFRAEVQMLQALSQPISGAPADVSSDSFAVDDPAARELVDHGLPRHQDLFVGLLDFSRHGDAGPLPHEGAGYPQPVASDERARAMRCPGAADDGRYYLILEIAMETMEDFLERRTASRQPLRLAEVRQTFRELCEVVTGLHGRGLVHLDLKPANLMRFPSGRFKLIDMDGVQPCGRTVPVTDITCTAQYCSPEVAGALLRVDEDAELTISRLMDVYSLGLVGAELAAGEHPLEDLWTHHCGNSGATEDEDEREFYRSIVDPDFEVQLPPAIRGASPELEELLRSMLRTRGRVSMPEVMAHPFWHGPAEPAAPSPRAAPGGEAAR